MKRRWRILIAASGCAVLAVVAWLLFRERGPSYNGRTLSEWCVIGAEPGRVTAWSSRWSRGMSPEAQEASDAIRRIGTNGLPWLVKWVRYEPERSVLWKLEATADKTLVRTSRLGRLVKAMLTDRAALRGAAALYGFKVLGAEAKSAVPELVQCARNEGSSGVRAIVCLGYLGDSGLAALVAIATNKEAQSWKRTAACGAIGGCETGTNAAGPLRLLDAYLQERGKDPGEAAVKAAAETALVGLSSRPAGALVVLSNMAASRDSGLLDRILSKCGEGPEWRPVAPALVGALTNENYLVREAAARKLQKIAPEMLTNGFLNFDF